MLKLNVISRSYLFIWVLFYTSVVFFLILCPRVFWRGKTMGAMVMYHHVPRIHVCVRNTRVTTRKFFFIGTVI